MIPPLPSVESIGFVIPYGDESNIIWFGAIFSFAVIAVTIPALIHAYYARRMRQRSYSQKVKRKLRELDLDDGEDFVLRSVAADAGAPLGKCLDSVEVFDRGIQEFLARTTKLSSVQRVDILRTSKSLRRKLEFDSTPAHRILQSTRTLQVGQEVSAARVGGTGAQFAAGAILQIDDDGITIRLQAGQADAARKMLSASPNDEMEIHFFHTDDCAYSFRSRLLETRDHGPGVIRIAHPKKLFRQQRRDFLRVDTYEQTQFRWFPASFSNKRVGFKREVEHVMTVYHGVVTNLSGGGLQLQAKDVEIAAEDWVEVHFPFLPPPLDRESCLSRVVQVYRKAPTASLD